MRRENARKLAKGQRIANSNRIASLSQGTGRIPAHIFSHLCVFVLIVALWPVLGRPFIVRFRASGSLHAP
jgi:hypothetical protein